MNKIIANTVEREGGYVNHEDDRGGATKYGITERVARQYGYEGDMRDLPLETNDVFTKQNNTVYGVKEIYTKKDGVLYQCK